MYMNTSLPACEVQAVQDSVGSVYQIPVAYDGTLLQIIGRRLGICQQYLAMVAGAPTLQCEFALLHSCLAMCTASTEFYYWHLSQRCTALLSRCLPQLMFTQVVHPY
jgi:hypothetical protein